MLGWVTVAEAATTPTDTGISSGCPVGVFPDDGDGPVPPDVVLTGVGLDPHCLGPTGAQLQGGGASIPGEVTFPDLQSVRFTPDAELDRGTYQGMATNGWVEQLATFTVGPPKSRLPISPGVADVDLSVDRHCAALRPPTLVGTVTLEDPAAGVLQAQVLTDGISSGWFSVAAGSHMEPGMLAHDVPSGDHEHCVELRLLDERAEVAWTADPACVQAERCPARAQPAGGCATAPVGTWWGSVAPVLVALLGRRTTRRSAAAAGPR